MAELNRSFPDQHLELEQILNEAKHRWLRPAEICEILRNYPTFELKSEAPITPPAGSLFLFDRKALRYFRKDGHRWRKKKDGKTVKEAHEKLKASSVDVLHCYYAHGEENENFQRRSYWMLEERLAHIVLVHYRDIKEGSKSGVSRLSPSPKSQVASPLGSPLGSSTPCSIQENSPAPSFQTSPSANSSRVSWNVQPSSEYEDVNSDDIPGSSSFTMPPFPSSLGQPTFASCLAPPPFGTTFLSSSHISHGVEGFTGLSKYPVSSFFPESQFHNPSGSSSVWSGVRSSTGNENTTHNQKFNVEQPNSAEFITSKLTDAKLDVDHKVPDHGTWGDRLISDTDIVLASKRDIEVPQKNDLVLGNPDATFIDQVQRSDKYVSLRNNESAELKKLDSFGRWMDVTIGPDCDDSLMASGSENYWNTLGAGNDDKEVSSLSHHIQLDNDSLGPSLSQEQLYSIGDFSPDWGYSGVGTKVLIVGRFLGEKKHYAETKWGCMFGEVEVPAEVVVDNVLRCVTPLHAPGRVPFYVTRSNRLACSEVREFEYREVTSKTPTNSSPEDVCLQIRLGKLLNLGSERKYLNCSTVDCDKCELGTAIYSMKVDCGQRFPGEPLIHNLLAERLCQWLVSKIHEGGKGPHVLDNEGQGVIHLSASLGYQWAMGPIIAAGVGPNFRDSRGRTGLHWASCFGREETVLELIRLGASPGAVEDPTPAFPGGQTAADLASRSGHKGIAGYLAEADLTRLVLQLNIDANVTIDKAIKTEPEASVSTDDQSMKGSLDAVRKSTHAVSLIQDAFRNRAFRHRQLANDSDSIRGAERGLASLVNLNKGQKFGHFEDSLHSAAKNIQKRYRGWRRRNDFLDLRSSVVKIQAHVRGHQVRKHYKKLVWSVGIVEKLILRWRRKGTGLRGFRADKAVEDSSTENKKGNEYEFLDIGRKQKSDAVEKALSRVKSMIRNREHREQYMRLVSKFNQSEMGGDGTSASQNVDSS